MLELRCLPDLDGPPPPRLPGGPGPSVAPGGDSCLTPEVDDPLGAGPGRTTQFLDRLRQAPGGRRGGALEAGQFVGRYRLIRRVGRGVHGEVWKAERPGPPGGPVALKVLRDQRRRDRFRAEAAIGARRCAPALLATLEAGEDDAGAFLVMPWVDGFALDEVIAQRRGRLEGRSAVAEHWRANLPGAAYTRSIARVLERVARAAGALHAQRVAHRDIKPANILVHRYCPDRVFLSDFGIALDLAGPPAPPPRDGAGTPLYMAPEKLLGQAADELRCDVYSLGVTLFEAVTLSPPVAPPERIARPCLGAYLATAPPSRPRALRPDLAPGLEAIILKAMARDPARRYATAAGLADDLDGWLTGAPGGGG